MPKHFYGYPPTIMSSELPTHGMRSWDHAYMDDVDIIIIGKSFQHFTDRGPDQFKGQSRHASTPGKQQLEELFKYLAEERKVCNDMRVSKW